MADYEVVCPKCGCCGKLQSHVFYDTFTIASCTVCNNIGTVRGIRDTTDFEIYTIIT